MKKLIFGGLLLTAMLVPGPAEARPSVADQARLQVTRASLRNFVAALDMWQADHGGSYPARLEELVPNYLRHIPPGPAGSSSDWEYQPERDRYRIAPRGELFTAVGLANPTASAEGLQPPPGELAPALDYRLSLPKDQANLWTPDGFSSYQREGHAISSRVAGPFAFGQSGSDWISYALREYRGRPEVRLESERPVNVGVLSGVETVGGSREWRSHTFYLTDGQAGWIFEYVAREKDFSPEVDAMFVEMLKVRANR